MSENNQEKTVSTSFTSFANALSEDGYTPAAGSSYDSSYFSWDKIEIKHEYSLDEASKIVESGSADDQKALSEAFFLSNGLYRQIIILASSVLDFTGLMIPIPAIGKSLQTKSISKKYRKALRYSESIDKKELARRIFLTALKCGRAYGVVHTISRNKFCYMDLPNDYCRAPLKDAEGNYIVEFNVTYFDKETSTVKGKELALQAYPKEISNYYRKWAKERKATPWVRLPNGVGRCFEFFDARPMFLSIIPSIMQYEKCVTNELAREIEEIKKLLVVEMPHLNDGTFVIQPEEAEVMHKGMAKMLGKKNPNTSVLTTYGAANMFSAKSGDNVTKDSLSAMSQNVYTNAGASSQIFSSTNSGTLKSSINYNITVAMWLADKIAKFIGEVINTAYGDGDIQYRYRFLPVGRLNADDYITQTLKLANAGYSFLLPALASGISQEEIEYVKDLENVVLELSSKLLPLSSSYTQSAQSGTPASGEQGGRPSKEGEEQSDKTIKNKESKENMGD